MEQPGRTVYHTGWKPVCSDWHDSDWGLSLDNIDLDLNDDDDVANHVGILDSNQYLGRRRRSSRAWRMKSSQGGGRSQHCHPQSPPLRQDSHLPPSFAADVSLMSATPPLWVPLWAARWVSMSDSAAIPWCAQIIWPTQVEGGNSSSFPERKASGPTCIHTNIGTGT